MRILHFCESLLRGGGIASFVSNLVGEQAKTNDVSVVVVNEESSVNRVDIAENVSQGCLGKKRLGFSVKYPVLIYKYIRKNKPDIVHIHSSFLYYALAVILLHRTIKFVYTIHSDAVKENASKWDKRFFWLKRFCFKCGWISPVTISKESKRSFDELYGVDSRLIVNGIKKPASITPQRKLDKYRYTSNTKMFYHPGRITEAKNQVVLCEVFHQLISEKEDVVLLISGTKQDSSIYKQLEYYFSDRILYLGERKDVIELLCEADAMCLPSRWEGMPIVLLEALSVGCIPICSSVGGLPEVIADGENGFLSQSPEFEDYIKVVRRFLLLSDVEICQMKNRTLQSFEKYSVEETSKAYCNYYHLLSNKSR